MLRIDAIQKHVRLSNTALLFLLFAFLLFIFCCAPQKRHSALSALDATSSHSPEIKPPVSQKADVSLHSPVSGDSAASKYKSVERSIRDEFKHWEGTRHILGGNDLNGVDCSGFVKAVYKNIFNIHLPRTTRTQVKNGIPVGHSDLKSGDLVFFRPPTYPYHVGIFLTGDEFVHASKSKGVTISHIDNLYWGKYYWTARRILPGN